MKWKVTAVLRMVPMLTVMGTIFFLSHQTGDSLSLPPLPGLDKISPYGSVWGIGGNGSFCTR